MLIRPVYQWFISLMLSKNGEFCVHSSVLLPSSLRLHPVVTVIFMHLTNVCSIMTVINVIVKSLMSYHSTVYFVLVHFVISGSDSTENVNTRHLQSKLNSSD